MIFSHKTKINDNKKTTLILAKMSLNMQDFAIDAFLVKIS